jgi:hypothetical protein
MLFIGSMTHIPVRETVYNDKLQDTGQLMKISTKN